MRYFWYRQALHLSILTVSIRQVKAARELLGWSQKDLAHHSGLSEPTIKRLEARNGDLGGREGSRFGVVCALRDAGIDFIPENGGGQGVRLRKRIE
jgi:DNA-binding XRE family transcriptional regulator